MLVDPESPLKKVELTDDLTCWGPRTAKIAIKSPLDVEPRGENEGKTETEGKPEKAEEKKPRPLLRSSVDLRALGFPAKRNS